MITDGEKRDRHRESEFTAVGENHSSIQEQWTDGWRIAFAAIENLKPADLKKTITIRGQTHSVVQAIQRNLNHVVYHTGQIVQLARHFAGDAW
ncbi:MAG: DUF1572 domain-containing protein [Caldithrix sp.]|nr:MAG: DUF1572 domain-containing protein [Caldithrix sp.]